MLTGEVKNRVDRIWEIFWTGGITNPLTVIEQFTYLIFIKSLDEKQLRNEKEGKIIESEIIFDEKDKDLRWHNFKSFEAEKMYDMIQKKVFPFIKSLNKDSSGSFTKYMEDAIFLIPTAEMLGKIVRGIDGLVLEGDMKGDLYEYLLSKLSTSGRNGQFRTPRHIIKMMVRLTKPMPTDTIVDPACGTSGFLVESSEYLKEECGDLFKDEKLKYHYHNTMFYGDDMDNTMLRISAMNLFLHDVENPQIEYKNSLSKSNTEKEKYTLILANPPFTGSLDKESVSGDLLEITYTSKTELLFLSLFTRILKKDGRCATIVPDGVLSIKSNAHMAIRKELLENNSLDGVISMPSGIFRPYSGVKTSILIFTKTGVSQRDKLWFYDMEADGYSLDDKREKIEASDIEDIVNRFHNMKDEEKRSRSEKSFFVPKDEIVKKDYLLSIQEYREERNAKLANIDKTKEEIIKDIIEKEDLINNLLMDLKEMFLDE